MEPWGGANTEQGMVGYHRNYRGSVLGRPNPKGFQSKKEEGIDCFTLENHFRGTQTSHTGATVLGTTCHHQKKTSGKQDKKNRENGEPQGRTIRSRGREQRKGADAEPVNGIQEC